MKTQLDHWRDLRRPRFSDSYPGVPLVYPALQAWRMAWSEVHSEDTRRRWQEAGGDIIPDHDLAKFGGLVCIVCCADSYADIDDLAGDMFVERLHPDINPNILAKEEREFHERVERDGVWGYRAMVRDRAGHWDEVDAIWGFVDDDFKGSGYDVNLMNAAMSALAERRAEEAEVEAFSEEVSAT